MTRISEHTQAQNSSSGAPHRAPAGNGFDLAFMDVAKAKNSAATTPSPALQGNPKGLPSVHLKSTETKVGTPDAMTSWASQSGPVSASVRGETPSVVSRVSADDRPIRATSTPSQTLVASDVANPGPPKDLSTTQIARQGDGLGDQTKVSMKLSADPFGDGPATPLHTPHRAEPQTSSSGQQNALAILSVNDEVATLHRGLEGPLEERVARPEGPSPAAPPSALGITSQHVAPRSPTVSLQQAAGKQHAPPRASAATSLRETITALSIQDPHHSALDDGIPERVKPVSVPVTVTRRESHLPPTHLALPADTTSLITEPAKVAPDILTQIRSAFAVDPSQETSRGEINLPRGNAPPPAQNGMVKVVEIMMKPASLGLITVTMRLAPSGLRVSLSTNVRDTADQLRDHQDSLRDIMGEAGYDVENIVISHTPKA